MKNRYWKVFVSTIIKNGDEILALKRKKDSYFGDYYDFPGGKMEFGEHIEDAAIREVLEETGIVINKENFSLEGHIDWIDEFEDEDRYAVCFCFVYKSDIKPEVSLKEDEHVSYKWVKKDDSCLDDFLIDILKRCGI